MVKLFESVDHYTEKYINSRFVLYTGKAGGGYDFIYNIGKETGFLYFDDFAVYVKVPSRTVDDFAAMYFNGSDSDPTLCREYGIEDTSVLANFDDDDSYFQFFVDNSVIESYRILDPEVSVTSIINSLVLGYDLDY